MRRTLLIAEWTIGIVLVAATLWIAIHDPERARWMFTH